MIAPEPFFEPRGTPFSEYYRIKGLIDLGHSIDLVTYPFGEDKKIQSLKIIRCAKPPFINRVKTGPSFSKIILDIFLIIKVIGMFIKNKYDLIHTHEEANIIGAILNKITKIPHLYDMHSSLVQQMNNFQFTKSKNNETNSERQFLNQIEGISINEILLFIENYNKEKPMCR